MSPESKALLSAITNKLKEAGIKQYVIAFSNPSDGMDVTEFCGSTWWKMGVGRAISVASEEVFKGVDGLKTDLSALNLITDRVLAFRPNHKNGTSNPESNGLKGLPISQKFSTMLADPPWRFINRTGKVAPEHRRLSRYETMTTEEIAALKVASIAAETAHLYLWVPNAMLPDGLRVMAGWGFTYKGNIVWHKLRKDGGSDGRGVGFYFRNVTEILLFGIRGKNARTLPPGRTQVNYLGTRKREHSRKPDEQYDLIESCSPGPYLELFARGKRAGWTTWGNQAVENYEPTWATYPHNSASERQRTQAIGS